MSTQLKVVNAHIQVNEINSLCLAFLQKTDLLGDSASEYLQSLLHKISSTQMKMIGVIKEGIVKSETGACLEEMKSAYVAFYQLLWSNSLQKRSASRLAAEKLLGVVDPINQSLKRLGRQMVYHSHIKSLIARLEEAESQTLMAAIAYCDDAFERLKEAQSAFISSYAQYHDLRKQQIMRDNASQLKQQLLQQINHELMPYLHVAANMGIDAYDSFHFAIDAMIVNQNMLIKRRREKRK